MDANQVGYVHELGWPEIKEIMDNAINIKPRRQMSIQFSGGEPTLSPYFLDAVSYAREIGYSSTQAATNGIEFAKSPEFARLRLPDFDSYISSSTASGTTNSHRQIGNLRRQTEAIENLHAAGVELFSSSRWSTM
jgi:uncharacterized radical SAM superfamily Fe-S cluster-containing enzyme